MLVNIHRSYLSQFCLEVVAKHSLLQIPNWLDGSRGWSYHWENCTCSDEEDKEQGPCEPSGDRHQLGGGQEALVHLGNKNISWAGLSSPDNITNHYLHCTEYQKWQNRRDEERSSFSQSHFLKSKLWSSLLTFGWAFQLKKVLEDCLPYFHVFRITMIKICIWELKFWGSRQLFGSRVLPAQQHTVQWGFGRLFLLLFDNFWILSSTYEFGANHSWFTPICRWSFL